MNTILVAFNVSYDRLARSGYRKCVAFPLSVGTVPLYSSADPAARSSEGRTAPSPLTGKSSTVRAKRMQVHRSNRVLASTPSPFLPGWES